MKGLRYQRKVLSYRLLIIKSYYFNSTINSILALQNKKEYKTPQSMQQNFPSWNRPSTQYFLIHVVLNAKSMSTTPFTFIQKPRLFTSKNSIDIHDNKGHFYRKKFTPNYRHAPHLNTPPSYTHKRYLAQTPVAICSPVTFCTLKIFVLVEYLLRDFECILKQHKKVNI